jgi:hypothetical protein
MRIDMREAAAAAARGAGLFLGSTCPARGTHAVDRPGWIVRRLLTLALLRLPRFPEQTQFLHAQPTDSDGAIYKSLVVVFGDLSADRAKGLFADVLEQLAVPSYLEDGLVMGGFYESNEGTAVYNRGFRPFMSPVPFLLMRHAVVRDWKFFLDNDDWLNRWARRYEESAVRALAEELRRLPWRAMGDESRKK